MNVQPFPISFSSDGRNVYMKKVMTFNSVSPTDPIVPAFNRNNLDPVLAGFKIVAQEGKRVLINVSKFFCSNERSISPLKETSPIAKLMGGTDGIKGTFQAEASGFVSAQSFPMNIEIESLLSYQTTGVIQKPYSVIVHRSLFALPEASAMPIRYKDNRVGFFYNDKTYSPPTKIASRNGPSSTAGAFCPKRKTWTAILPGNWWNRKSPSYSM